jgi:hypothetical protein
VEALCDKRRLDAFGRKSTDRLCKVIKQDVHLLHQARITCVAA